MFGFKTLLVTLAVILFVKEGTGPHQKLLNDPDIKRWYDNVARGSRITADVYLRRLGNFCIQNKLTPNSLVSKKEKDLYNTLMDLVTSMERGGNAGSYITSTLKAVKSWLAYNDIEIKRKIRVKGAQETPSLKDERVPTQRELQKILSFADPKVKVAASLVAFAGLRLESLGSYLGNDGLKIRDIPELDIKGSEVNLEQVPAMVVVRPGLSKARHQYFTFFAEEGCEYLTDYLENRIREGEKLKAESPIIRPKLMAQKSVDRPFIRTNNIGDALRLPIRKVGFSWRPYVLRAYFDTQLMLAESKGLILRDYRTFFMGHKGDIEARYTTNKQKLPESVIEDMRSSYQKAAVEFLQTKMTKPGIDELDLKLKERMLMVAGYTQEDLLKLDMPSLSDDEINKMVRERLFGVPNGSKQKVIQISEVKSYVVQGWEYVTQLPDSSAIVKLPV